MNGFVGNKELDETGCHPDDRERALLHQVSDPILKSSGGYLYLPTTKNGIPVLIDWKFHHGTPAGIGFHLKINASQLVADEASSAAETRNPTARRQRG